MFTAFLKLAQHADPTYIDLHYAASRASVGGIDQSEFVQFQYGKNPQRAREVFAEILKHWQKEQSLLAKTDYIASHQADNLIRSIHPVLLAEHLNCPQAILNEVAQAFLSLWKLSRFELRHVWPATRADDNLL